MKCPICGGKGFVHNALGGFNEDCGICDGTGEIYIPPQEQELQTNEEWFYGLSTEEKAKEIYKIAKDNFKELRKQFYGVANDDIDAIAMWLKEKHNG